jgi:hypothetical protein
VLDPEDAGFRPLRTLHGEMIPSNFGSNGTRTFWSKSTCPLGAHEDAVKDGIAVYQKLIGKMVTAAKTMTMFPDLDEHALGVALDQLRPNPPFIVRWAARAAPHDGLGHPMRLAIRSGTSTMDQSGLVYGEGPV